MLLCAESEEETLAADVMEATLEMTEFTEDCAELSDELTLDELDDEEDNQESVTLYGGGVTPP